MNSNASNSRIGFLEEFEAVDLLVGSAFETRGVDAFALSVIKHERQLRKLLTYTVFQSPCFTAGPDVARLREILSNNREVYARGLIKGLDAIWPHSLADLIGPRYTYLRATLEDARKVRGKLFHGQLTDRRLDRTSLLSYVKEIKEWCGLLGVAAQAEVGYDGFGRNSYHKGADTTLQRKFRHSFTSFADYEQFVANVLAT